MQTALRLWPEGGSRWLACAQGCQEEGLEDESETKASEGCSCCETSCSRASGVVRRWSTVLSWVGCVSDNSCRKGAFSEIKVASGVMVASLVVDDPDICNLLLSRLKSREKFACEVYVDEDTYTKMRKQYPHQRPRLLELQKHGASVFLCSGREYCEEFGVKGYRGHFHMKALVIDNKIAYRGSANATRNSPINTELFFSLGWASSR